MSHYQSKNSHERKLIMQSRKQSHLNVKGHLKLTKEWKQKWNNLPS